MTGSSVHITMCLQRTLKKHRDFLPLVVHLPIYLGLSLLPPWHLKGLGVLRLLHIWSSQSLGTTVSNKEQRLYGKRQLLPLGLLESS